MKKKQIKKSFKNMILLHLFIILLIIFIQACKATPATAITDANEVAISGTFRSVEPVLGQVYLSIGITDTSITVGFTGGNNISATETLTNVAGGLGNYNFQNGNMSASIRFADENSMRASITSLKKELSFSLENVACNK